VIPLALELTDQIQFMVVVSGGGEDSIEQAAFQIRHELECSGVSSEQGELVERYFPQYAKGDTYELYTEAMNVLLPIPGMTRKVGDVIADEENWQPWPPEIDAYLDPMDVVRTTTIPVLAVFGELDKNVDPHQGSAAYEAALQEAGNTNYHVEMISGIGHTMQEQSTGCLSEAGGPTSERYLALLDEWSQMLAEFL
jgi:pimeloyl-ACP methyl ester carboxylesterase